jgi:hypothetical protein
MKLPGELSGLVLRRLLPYAMPHGSLVQAQRFGAKPKPHARQIPIPLSASWTLHRLIAQRGNAAMILDAFLRKARARSSLRYRISWPSYEKQKTIGVIGENASTLDIRAIIETSLKEEAAKTGSPPW